MVEWLLLVDEKDNVIGKATREQCHSGNGKLHRAYLIMIKNNDKILLLKRSELKKLWPNCWDGSVASHVHVDEDDNQSAVQRLKDELGVEANIERIGEFIYFEKFGDNCENEFCHLYVCEFNGKVVPNKSEISESRYVEIAEIKKEVKSNPQVFTPWFKIAFRQFLKLRSK